MTRACSFSRYLGRAPCFGQARQPSALNNLHDGSAYTGYGTLFCSMYLRIREGSIGEMRIMFVGICILVDENEEDWGIDVLSLRMYALQAYMSHLTSV